jgi:hypothetical protein
MRLPPLFYLSGCLPADLSRGSASPVRLRPVFRTGKKNQTAKSAALGRAVEICRPYNQKQEIIFRDALPHHDADVSQTRRRNQFGKKNLETTARLPTISLGVFQHFVRKTVRKGWSASSKRDEDRHAGEPTRK